jgi:DHA2 family multidrug resistance protein-like MFS transporter
VNAASDAPRADAPRADAPRADAPRADAPGADAQRADVSRADVSRADVSRAGRREWIGLGVLAVPCLLYAMDLTVLNLAVPAISRSLRPSSVELLWIVDIYGFVLAGSLITMGTLGDRIGRRRLLLAGAAGFAGASVLAAYSASPGMLIAARALLGVAGATLAPSTLSLIRNMFQDPGQRRIAVGVWISSFSAGGAAGPLIGGLLLEWFWWGSVFLLAVPFMALLLVLGPLLLPEFRDPEPGRLDPVSAGLSLAAVLALIYGLKQFAEGGGPGWVAALAIVAGVAAGALFVHRQHRLATPLLDLRLFRLPGFTAALSTNVVSFFIGFGILLFTSQYLQLVLRLSPLEAGLWMLPSSAGFILGSMLTPVLVRRARPAFVMASGLGLAATGFALLTQLGTGRTAGLALLVTGSVVYSVALAPVDTLATDVAVGAAPPERAGAVTAITETSAEVGGALGIALLGLAGTAVYRSRIAGAIPPGVPVHAARAARDTLGGAVAAAGQLPGPMGPALASAARQAFGSGLHVVFAISAIASLAAAALTVTLFRQLSPSGPEQEPDTQPEQAAALPALPRAGSRRAEAGH